MALVWEHHQLRRDLLSLKRGKELGLAYDHRIRTQAPRAESGRPIDVRGVLRRQLCRRHFVVVRDRITQVLELSRRFRERSLERHDVLCRFTRRRLIASQQLQRARDVLHVLAANARDAGVRIEIEIALRHSQATLR